MMDAADFRWVPAPEFSGVHAKLLGVFTERRAQASFFKLEAGATLRGAGRAIYVVYAGGGRIDAQPLRRFTAVFLEHGERASFAADEATEMLHLGLPDLRDLAAQPQAFAPAVAARSEEHTSELQSRL